MNPAPPVQLICILPFPSALIESDGATKGVVGFGFSAENPNPTTPLVAPSLSISADGNGNIQINWTGGAGFTLQSSTDLTAYSEATGTIQVTDDVSTYTESIESGNKFFKLTNE